MKEGVKRKCVGESAHSDFATEVFPHRECVSNMYENQLCKWLLTPLLISFSEKKRERVGNCCIFAPELLNNEIHR